MPRFESTPLWESALLAIVVIFVVLGCMSLTGCASAPPATPTAEVPVAVPVDCHFPDPGPKPDLSAAAGLTKATPPQQALTIMGAALALLAEDDARLRALMNHGH